MRGGVVSMAVTFSFICDGCGATGNGVPGQYLHPSPPLGWKWRFGSGLEAPHACSEECWSKVRRLPDGRVILHDSHEEAEQLLPAPPTPKDMPHRDAPVGMEPAHVCVYFIQRGGDGPIKIGFSKNPTARLAQLQASVPEPLRLLAVEYDLWGGKSLEQRLHKRFKEHRLSGEWFSPAPAILAHVAALRGSIREVR